jgi:hypothetical protein
MTAVKAHYDGRSFIPESPIVAEINQEAIVTLLEPRLSPVSKKERLLNLAGRISHEDYLEMEKALLDTEKVSLNEW